MHATTLHDSDFQRSLLEALQLFRGVDPDVVQDLLSGCGRHDLAAGELLLRPDRENNSVYVVLSGQLRVHLGSVDNQPLADLEVGDCAGEMSIIEEKDPSAYVIAVEDTHLMVINHQMLWKMVDRSHQFAKNLLIVLTERVRSNNQYIADSIGILREAKLHAVTDALTGLHNRHWIEEMFPREMSRCQQNGEPACLVMVDVDGFKTFNDQCGHVAGDRVLSAVSKALRNEFRPTDLIARFGGDEFVVLLPRLGLTDGLNSAERARRRIRGDTESSADSLIKVPVSMSLGVAEMSKDDTLDSLLARADSALYRAKTKGRDCVSD